MFQEYDPSEHVYLTRDTRGNVRELLHMEQPFVPEAQFPQLAAREYLERFGKFYNISVDELKNLAQEPERELVDAGVEYRFLEVKEMFDTTTVGVQQTYFGLPVWRAGLSVTIRREPLRVVSSQSTHHEEITIKRPKAASLRRLASPDTRGMLPMMVSLPEGQDKAWRDLAQKSLRVINNRLIIYRYEAARRQTDERPQQREPAGMTDKLPQQRESAGLTTPHGQPSLPLPPVPEVIEDGTHYVCREITFNLATPATGVLAWVAIIELETQTVLYLRAFTDNVDGMVFLTDPITATGNAANAPTANNATLNPLRSSATLQGLTAPPPGGNQSLSGNFVQISDFEPATVAPPTQSSGVNFNYNVRTNDFAAVNAYYHADRFFRLVQDLGFNIGTYFGGTIFPTPVDHRGRYGSTDGIEVNASCSGNGMSGIANTDFELADTTDTTNPIGIALDWRVVLHELGGHGVLYNHVNSANFGFAHSAGDSFAAILNDPDTQAPDRFVTFPWINIGRRHDRSVASGWGWGGANDIGSYSSEQILCTTHFRIYRSLGGDSASANMRRFAARFMAYLMLRAIGTLTPATNPNNPLGYANALLTADQGDWTSEGHSGGAYGKVIRWSFEKQGLYQPAGAPTPVTSAGAPPAVDVYIDDGRGGEYQFQANHWSNQKVWNRRNADSGTTHEEPVVGQTNYAYVKIKNRGTQTATNVVIKGFHCIPSTGLVWPNDWQAMTTAQLSSPNVPPNSSAEITVGPFEWTPSQLGHECMLMIASASGDPSNIDNFTAGDSIPEWRLVPHDNNIGQRNVHPVAGGGGLRGLLSSLTREIFYAGNPNPKRARVVINARIPALLKELGWEVIFLNPGGRAFALEPGQSKEVAFTLKPGKDFTPAQVEAIPQAERAIEFETFADGILVGGMTYPLDPSLKAPLPQPGKGEGKPCADVEKELLECLKLRHDGVKSVKVRRITVDINFEDDCD